MLTLTTDVINVVMVGHALKKPVYLRGIPEELVREAKARAAQRGVTLASFVADAISSALREQPTATEPNDELTRDMHWYERNRERLARDFAGAYVAIAQRRVIDHDADFEQLAERVFAREGARDVFMPRVSERSRPLRIRSPRIARGRTS